MPGATQLFFSDDIDDIAEAKRVCAGCPVMAECLEGACAGARRGPHLAHLNAGSRDAG